MKWNDHSEFALSSGFVFKFHRVHVTDRNRLIGRQKSVTKPASHESTSIRIRSVTNIIDINKVLFDSSKFPLAVSKNKNTTSRLFIFISMIPRSLTVSWRKFITNQWVHLIK